MPSGERVEGLGTAGTPVGGVLTVQGSGAAGTPMPINLKQWNDVVVAAAAALSDAMATAPVVPPIGAYALLIDPNLGTATRARTPTAAIAQAKTGFLGVIPMLVNGAIVNPMLDANSGDGIGPAGIQETVIAGMDPLTATTATRARAVVGGDVNGPLRQFPQYSVQNAVIAGGANAIATLTLPAAGVGLFHYITALRIARVATAALAGGALLVVTTTNLGGKQWRVGNVMVAGGTDELINIAFPNPIRSILANTATTIVGPAAGAAVSWDMEVDYFNAPYAA